ncbi:hypothetical protein REIP_1726 [Rickettsia endosymbiont of Ixodes pacificus]|nr:hypothetical protein REIP_p285 [Rickettsia endosymbiont of Ixodes pacificus]AKS10378.1 hypothetical protein REIP_p400 [Rickettsia endosymbiont of Ixodes pacificus]KJW01734.1 hypothetical protein REIP_1826 [Rickettsia endosymbiont of Ixodes pacificus]KJW01800.1 hypothetical protein REIP_1782 [Rickettsia endosymbiont of Ixodes pacificus]KJW01830.1 hypothetical protein REIP_1756 [Rickettsia endosymbiont of Ixodes pacificus]
MKSQYQNFQKHLNGNYSNQESILNANASSAITDEALNQDNRICYKKRREELNRRVKSLLEQKKQVSQARN